MKDLDQCQQIVSNAKRSLLDSKMFDYSQLVDTACNGLLSPQGMNSAKWNEFSEFIRFSQMAQESSPELHDALLYTMKYGDSSGQSTVEMSYVKQMMANDSLNEWQSTIAALSAENLIEQRAPWIWRSVPDGKYGDFS
jgi:hypothetical protein